MKRWLHNQPCPCGRTDSRSRPLRFEHCCQPWLETDAPAPDAHTLMRSRYCAFVLERADYLLQTWHPSTRPAHIEFEPGVKWLGLEVRSHVQPDDTHAQVEFVARQRPPSGPALRLHENSQFVLEHGRWFYCEDRAQDAKN